jgi:hypothetical protein
MCTLLAAVAGCSATSAYELSVSETRSAVESARLAVDLYARGDSTAAVAQTAVSDAVDQAIGAEGSLAQTRSSNDAEAGQQRTADQLVHESTTLLLETERQLSAGTAGSDELADLGRRLDALDAQLQQTP